MVHLARLATIVLGAAIAALFFWMSGAAIVQGLSNVDDGFFAVAAKAWADGFGFGMFDAYGRFIPFNPYNGAGPVMLAPIGALTWMLGPSDTVPGAASLAIFTAQMLVVSRLVASSAGWVRAINFVSVAALVMMIACAASQWYFGVLIGEPTCFGFIAIGLVLLARGPDVRQSAIAGLCFALAYLTKQLAAVPIAGIIAAWLLLSFDWRRLTWLLAGGATPVLAVEAWKLIELGPAGYLALWPAAVTTSRIIALGSGTLAERIPQVIEAIGHYAATPVAAGAVCAAVIGVVATWNRRTAFAWRLAAIATSGALVHLVYYATMSRLYPRYIWLSVGLICAALASPLLALPRVRSSLAAAAIVALLIPLHLPGFQMIRNYWLDNPQSAERRAAADVINAASLPVASQNWNGRDDVLYLVRGPRLAVYGHGIDALRGREFLAIVNLLYSDLAAAFSRDVRAQCRSLIADRQRVEVYHCDAAFWRQQRALAR